jgi:hypothetical protein
MLQVAARMEASDLLDGLGQGVDQAAGGIGSLGKDAWASRPVAAPARPTADQATKKTRRKTGSELG